MRGGKATLEASFWFNIQKMALPQSSGGSLDKKPHLETRIENFQDSRESSGHECGNNANSRKNVRCVGRCG